MANLTEVLEAFACGTYKIDRTGITDENHYVSAVWDDALDKWDYYVTDVYNSPTDYAFIDIEALERLKRICDVLEGLQGEEEGEQE